MMSIRLLLPLLLLSVAGVASASAPKAPPDAIETASGMRYVVLKAAPSGSTVVQPTFIEYRALIRSADGKVRQEGDQVRATSFRRLAQSLPGLARAVLSAPAGETRRWWIEAEQLKPGYPGMPLQTHVIDLTVLGNYDPVQTPSDLAAPPASATRTPSGLAYVVLRKGKGGEKPQADSTIEIHYSGWTTDGRLFDSSVLRDEPAVFPLPQLIAGWQEGIPLMSPGDSFRFWIPGHLAYDANPRPGAPRGLLVFDVTLLSFE